MKYLDYLLSVKEKGTQGRLGIIFKTKNNFYLFDAGTNKVAIIDEPQGLEFLSMFFNDAITVEKFKSYVDAHATDNTIYSFLKKMEEENLLQAHEVTSLQLLPPGESYEDRVDNHSELIILELTGKCNFRCKYCIYSEEFDENRNFNNEDMTWETARKAIDYACTHNKNTLSITFYGGEPLIKFDLMKKSIDYALDTWSGKRELSFSFTSNLSLLTEDMAEYFANVPNLSVTASIDGPKDIHDAFRVYANNKPTFHDTLRGLECIAKAFKNTRNSLMINAVYTPPYSYERTKRIGDFFASLPYLKDIEILISYPSPNTLHNIDKMFEDGEEKYATDFEIGNPLARWAWDNYINGSGNPMAVQYMFDRLKTAHFRMLLNAPVNHYHLNGNCTPGVRRLYVKTNGDFAICEKIGNSPVIGNVDEGIDVSKVKQYYIKEYEAASLPECSKCWAVNMCDLCYANCYSTNGINMVEKRKMCEVTRTNVLISLSMYYTLLEEHPEKLEFFKDATFT